MKALFLSHKNLLLNGGGGNQVCSREYRDVLVAAGLDLRFITHGTDQSLSTRMHRKLFPDRYPRLVPMEILGQVQDACQKICPEFVFCNFTNYLPFAAQLRAILPTQTKLVLLSHGLASMDDVHRDRIAREAFAKNHLKRLGPKLIGKAISTEREGLPIFDHVFCLAEFEVAIYRWLGARSVSWWPRTLAPRPELDWQPVRSRVGLVGTLDHPPNLEGVFLFCKALEQIGVNAPRLRLVTRSLAVARELKSRYKFVDDLGPLENPGELENEAATWSAYVHPIFCYAMGCSTKLATGISWGLPVLTTEQGLRGYAWREGNLCVAADATEMAQMAMKLLDAGFSSAARVGTLRVRATMPSLAAVAQTFRQTLLSPTKPQ